MKYRVLRLASACFGALFCSQADAAKITPIKLDDGKIVLLLTGTIEHGDAARFRSEASKYDKAEVVLESDGGALSDALEIGKAIRLQGYGTAVLNGSDCNSACALIWLAGTPRKLSKSGRVGFHAAYTDASGPAQESGVANAMVGRYLTLLNLPEDAVIFATTAPPSRLTWLTTANYRDTGIDLESINDVDWGKTSTTASSPTPPPLISIQPTARAGNANEDDTKLWKRVGGWSVRLDPSLLNGCFLYTTYEKGTILRIGVNREKENGYYMLLANSAWSSLQVGNTYDVQVQIGANTPWDAPMKAVNMNGSTALAVTFSDSRLWNEFVSSTNLRVTREGKSVANLSIADSRQAFDELVSCQKYADAHTPAADPFAQ